MNSPLAIGPQTHGPHTHQARSVAQTMGLVMFALIPATLFGFYNFGWPAIYLFLITAATALLAEGACLIVAGKPTRPFLLDGSALLSGWLLAMTLPPWAPWWIGVVGSLLAIVVGKQVFGGIGQNLFNPAMVARVALLIAFPLEMTTFLGPQPLFDPTSPDMLHSLAITFGDSSQIDAVSSATPLGHLRTELGRGMELSEAMSGHFESLSAILGNTHGSMGETSALLILLGGLFLLYKRIITWHIPVSLIGTIALLATLFHAVDPQHYPNALFHIFSGATFLGAFFIATDLVTSPVSERGQLLFGAGCGLLVFVIRTWAGYPEGMAFAVMLMNGFTPLIDHYIKPRIYGRNRKGEPLVYPEHMGDRT